MKIISVIGSGVMGTGVAHLFSSKDYKVNLVDISSIQLEKSKEQIFNDTRLYQISGFKKFNIDSNKIINNINFTRNLNDVTGSDIIFENITENFDKKIQVHKEINSIIKNDGIISINSSAIPITKLASLYKNATRVIGTHFMNPVLLMPTVEVILGNYTSEETLKDMKDLLFDVGLESIVVNDSPGYVTNRAMMIFVNEAIFMLQENVTSAENIDSLFKRCFGHKMGPLQTSDLIGLDTILYSLNVLYEEFNDDKYRPCWLLKKMVSSGKLGKKSGSGFYNY